MAALSSRLAGLSAALAALSCAPAAVAGVIEIAPDGSYVVHQGPGIVTDAGREAIVIGPAPRARAALAAPERVMQVIAEASERYQLNTNLVAAVAWQESRFSQAAISPKGAEGVMQLMPATARGLGVDARDLTQNIMGGAAYLAQMLRRYNGDLSLALAAYNAGPGAVDRYRGVPPYAETRAYVTSVLTRMAAMSARAL